MMKRYKADSLLNTMKPGRVYRRKELDEHSKAVDRELADLTARGAVKKLSGGLYLKPERSRFGELPPADNELVRAFLNDDRFLLMSFNHYNSLGLGLTQLRGETLVYNRKRHDELNLGSKKFVFKRKPEFPKKLSREFLLVDLLNNLNLLGEDKDDVLDRLQDKKNDFDKKKVSMMAKKYGKVGTKNFVKDLYA